MLTEHYKIIILGEFMKRIALKKIIEIAMGTLFSFGLRKHVLRNYQGIYRRLSEYYHLQGRTMFSPKISEEYVESFKQKYNSNHCSETYFGLIRRAIRILIEIYETGSVVWKPYQFCSRKILPTSTHYIEVHAHYLEYLNNTGLGKSSIELADFQSRDFLKYLEQKGLYSLKDVTPQEVSNYFPHLLGRFQPTSMRHVASYLRLFLTYIEKAGVINTRALFNAIPCRCSRKKPLIPVLSSEEMKTLNNKELSNNRSSKRDHAIILLALTTGLRSIDILHLRFEDIDWREETISIVQSKTGKQVTLPLFPVVGNALAYYILHERPESELSNVFLRSCAPFEPLSSHTACWYISAKAMKYAGIRQKKDERKGLHVIRHSVATAMLAEGVALPTISNILGHRKKESTNTYLTVDEVHLRQCALGFEGIEVSREELK